MDLSSVRSRPPGVTGVVLLTVLYSLLHLDPFDPQSVASFATLVMGLVVAYLLWQGRFVGWVAAVVLYSLLLFDLAVGVIVFGPTEVPHVAIPAVVLAYLLFAHDWFTTSTATSR